MVFTCGPRSGTVKCNAVLGGILLLAFEDAPDYFGNEARNSSSKRLNS